MPDVAIVTDSTASIPAELIQQYSIQVAPQVLIWGDRTYQDGIDIQPAEFYSRLNTAKIMPSTSQATPGAFISIFSKLAARDRPILAILLSEKLSGTIASAIQARESIPEAQIEIIDSDTVAMAMGFQVLAAARAAQQGASLAECKAIVEHARSRTGVIFAVDTLEFLHRGGRIGGASRFLGTALNIKPILEVVEGKVEAVERVRTRARSLQRLVELVDARTGGRKPVHLATLHANAEEDARVLMQMGRDCFETVEHLYTVVSPVIGTHTGPRTVGLAYMTEV